VTTPAPPVDAEVEHARDGAHGAVRVQRAEHHVPGHRGLTGNLGRLVVAHLAHQDHVGVLAQDRAQGAREGQPGLRVHLHLADAGQLVLDGSSTVTMLTSGLQPGEARTAT
jgi:hypothetical protein